MTRFRAHAPPAEVARVLGEVAELLEARWDRVPDLSPSPLSPSQLRAMFVLERAAGSNLTALAEALDVTPPSMSRLCDRLQAAGYIERTQSPSSRREVDLRLSERGHAYLDVLRGKRQESLREAIEALPGDARVALLDGLLPLRDAIEPSAQVSAVGREPSQSA
ncbi:MarR family winged helix-turn-helix transcriptional regulator [Actinokineospora sp. 24-640]